jgi:bifunctional ADP-heptose synthase (sugar kinase/adenylyltransferase)
MSLYSSTQQITHIIYNDIIIVIYYYSTMTRFSPLDYIQVVTVYKQNLKLQKSCNVDIG